MALRVDIDKTYLTRAIDAAIASLKRSKNAQTLNVKMVPIIDEDIRIYQNALNTMTEIK